MNRTSLVSFAFVVPALALTAAGCAAPAGDASDHVGTDESAIYVPRGCLGPITGAPIYRDSGFVAGQDGPNVATVRATLPACAARTWSSLWVHPVVTTITGHDVPFANYDVVPIGLGQPLVYTLDSLSPTTVYKISLQLFSASSGQWTQVGTVADYYTVTDGTDTLSRARSAIVLHGLKQYDDQAKGLVGYHGVQPDGTRYGAPIGESWCTEFYAWVTSSRLTTSSAAQTNTTEMEGYFGFVGVGAWIPGWTHVRWGQPGDYMPMGGGHHSTMILGYDAATDRVYTLEGNINDYVVLDSHAASVADGLGQIRPMMLKP